MAISLATQAQEEGTLTLADIKAQRVWVCFRFQNGTKPPFNPLTGRGAKQDDPTTWASYEEALQAFQNPVNHYDGIGFQLCPDFLPIIGVDLDHCVNSETGQIDAWAQEIIDLLASYTELSPSKTGAHILLVGNGDNITRHKIPAKEFTQNCRPGAKFEVYSQGRYFTLTEDRLPGLPAEIMSRQEQLQAVYEKVTSGRPTSVNTISQTERRPSFGPLDLTDNELLDRAMQAQNGVDFRRLWQGDIGANADKSTADFLLCQHLAFWTGKDAARIDRLFRRSALYRSKWDRKTGSSTYGELTIAKAINECKNEYTGINGAALRVEKEMERLFSSCFNQDSTDAWENQPYHLEPKEIPDKRVLECLDLNELGDSYLFTEAFEGLVLYDASEKGWYIWAGQFWKKDRTGKVRHFLSGHVGSIYLTTKAHLNIKDAEIIQQIEAVGLVSKEADKLKSERKSIEAQMKALDDRARLLRSAKRCLNVLNTYVATEDRIAVTGEIWDTNPWLLGTQNGVIDLKTGKFRDGRPKDYIRTVAPITWKGLTEQCPRFIRFLDEVFEDRLPNERVELIDFLQRLIGYSITGLTAEHIFPIFYGEEGRNGKDTLFSLLKFVLGPMTGPASNDVLVSVDKPRSAGSATPHLCALQGKRIVWGNETKQGDILNIAQIKHLTGGSTIPARPLYGSQYDFEPTHTLFLLTNFKPHASAGDKAFWERACLIEFNMRFIDMPVTNKERQKDKFLVEMLKSEASGILAWLIQGCMLWQQYGLKRPESVLIATNKYQRSEDQLQAFVDAICYTGDEKAEINATGLYNAYKEWCKENTLSAMNGTLFGKEFGKKYTKNHTRAGVCYHGIRLRTENDPFPELEPPPVSAQTSTGTGEREEGYKRGYGGVNQEETREIENQTNAHHNDVIREQLIAYGAAHSWPRLQLGHGNAIAAGEESWRLYVMKTKLSVLLLALNQAEQMSA